MIGFEEHKFQPLQENDLQPQRIKLPNEHAQYKENHLRNLLSNNSTVRILTTNCSNSSNSSNTSNCSNSSVSYARGKSIAQICGSECSDCPQRIDRRSNGQITPPKNAGECKSAIYAAVSIMQVCQYIKSQAQVDLSQSYLSQCWKTIANCSSTDIQKIFDWYQFRQPYIAKESDYTGNCSTQIIMTRMKSKNAYGECKLYKQISSQTQSAVISISSALPAASSYSSGVFRCTQTQNDASYFVHVVGYTQAYWIVKAHLGTSWGIGGYAHITRDLRGDCGITRNTQHYLEYNWQICIKQAFKILSMIVLLVAFSCS